MKLVLFSVLSLVIIDQAMADAPDEAKLKSCTILSETAANIMKGRQNGVSMAKLMAVKSGSKEYDNVLAEMVKDAYQGSAFSTESYKEKAISEFENKWFGICVK